jgi:hypothetical protein
MEKIIVTHNDMLGTLWFIGWLFTIGYLKLNFKKGLLGLIIWPYYLGLKYGRHDSFERVEKHHIVQ